MGNMNFLHMVPQKSVYIVERFGKFNRELSPGLNFTIPIVEGVPYKLSLKEKDYQIKEQEAVTKDNVHIFIDGILYLKIVDPMKSAYGSVDPIGYCDVIAQSIMRAEIGKLTLDRTFEEKEYLNHLILDQISVAIEDWGVQCIRYEIKDIHTENRFKDILNAQAKSERVKRATVRDAEGKKTAMINRAQGESQKLLMEAEAKARQISLNYEALATRLELISESIDKQDQDKDALTLSLSDDVFASLEKLAEGDKNIFIRKNLSRPTRELEKSFSSFKKDPDL